MMERAEVEKLLHDTEEWCKTASEDQHKAMQCIFEAIQEIKSNSMKDCVLAISICTQADLLGARPVVHWHNFSKFMGLAEFYEHCAKRIKDKEQSPQGRSDG